MSFSCWLPLTHNRERHLYTMLKGFVFRLNDHTMRRILYPRGMWDFSMMVHMLFLQKLETSSLWAVWKLVQSCDCFACLYVRTSGLPVGGFEWVFLCIVGFGVLAMNNGFVLLIVPSWSLDISSLCVSWCKVLRNGGELSVPSIFPCVRWAKWFSMVSERVGPCAERCCNLRLRLKPVSALMFCNGTDCFVIALVSESCLASFKSFAMS